MMHSNGWLKETNFHQSCFFAVTFKVAIEISRKRNLLDAPLAEAPELPFSLSAIPKVYPPPGQIRLWVTEIA
ncbi:MAG: hypothetical protein NTY38_08010 [Acidobacteria bacterium]|nr:hypothetical protein [Acidobacteriota bacterium]